jgi:hypothetical protein
VLLLKARQVQTRIVSCTRSLIEVKENKINTMAKKSIGDKITDTATDNLKLPVTFKEFSKNPVVATLFIVLMAIGYLYIDIKTTFKEQGVSQNIRIEKLENRVDVVSDALRRSDSLKAVTSTKLSTLVQLGKIQEIK